MKSEFNIINKAVQCFSMKPGLMHQGLLINVDREECTFLKFTSVLYSSVPLYTVYKEERMDVYQCVLLDIL